MNNDSKTLHSSMNAIKNIFISTGGSLPCDFTTGNAPKRIIIFLFCTRNTYSNKWTNSYKEYAVVLIR